MGLVNIMINLMMINKHYFDGWKNVEEISDVNPKTFHQYKTFMVLGNHSTIKNITKKRPHITHNNEKNGIDP